MSSATANHISNSTSLSSQSKTALFSLPYQPPIGLVSDFTPRLFALLIGINTYSNASSLRGAVADTRAFKDYLETCLGVPDDQIQLLLNTSASRSAILAALSRFRDNPKIEKGDPILVFFAGHGSEVAVDSGERKIQVIMPQDYSNDPENPVAPIPCRAVDKALHKVAHTKGDNIVVIYDCSFSGSIEQSKTALSLVRSVDLPPLVDSSLHQLAAESNDDSAPLNIVLNACSPSERARECRGRGSFLVALLRLFHTISPNELQWSELLSHMDQIPSQNPQYRGSHQNRYVFDAKIVSKERPCFPLTVADNGLILNAGTVHGISTGSEFTVYAAADISLLSAYGQLAMEELGPLSAVMKPSSINLPETVGTTIAVKTKAGEREDVRFYCPNDEAYAIFYEAFISMTMNASSDKCCTGVIVATPEDAHFEVAMEAGRVIFFIKDRTFTQYGVTRLFHEVGPVVEEIVPVIQAAAHYIWCFNLTESNPIVTANVQVEIFQLQHVQLLAIVRPATFVPVGPNLYQDDMVDLVLKGEDVPYGIKLTNNGVVDLYSNVFYFDSTDLSIGPYYQAALGAEPLKANGGTLTIGYGSSGGSPFCYFLRDTQDHDVGFIKVFLSTRPVNLSTMIQHSPTTASNALENTEKPPVDHIWGTILIPVIQRRSHTSPTGEWACSQCGFVIAPNLEEEYMKLENEDLKWELEIYRRNVSRQKQVLEAEYQNMLAIVERKKAKSALNPPVNDLGLIQPPEAFDPPAKSPSRWASLLERAKRLLRLWA